MKDVTDIRRAFASKYQKKEFVTDKTGSKTIELVGESFKADEECIFGTLNKEYAEKEIAWYNSLSTNINDIYGLERSPPKAWKYAADDYGNINSNYGHLIFSPLYFSQYAEAVYELETNPDSRRATMVYTRPSIWEEYKANGMSDFICTNAVNYLIRDGKIHATVQMRSNDIWAGYRNDRYWQKYVLELMAEQLEVEVGDINWQVSSLHMYEKDFYLLHHFIETGDITIKKSDYDKLYT